MAVVNTVGRRKTAIARAYMSEGKGVFTINNREAKEYFNSDVLLKVINKPFEVAELTGKYDVKINATGGGLSGQAAAISLAVARAIVELDAEQKAGLRAEGLMTRDPRMVERKKPGQKKARKKFQFSKR
ncbi:MAG: 30S ribosomal protein S9 [Flavobacteriales bacterium]|nr:30S ribosomal protein S9 [Flavobacteriales bacterium]